MSSAVKEFFEVLQINYRLPSFPHAILFTCSLTPLFLANITGDLLGTSVFRSLRAFPAGASLLLALGRPCWQQTPAPASGAAGLARFHAGRAGCGEPATCSRAQCHKLEERSRFLSVSRIMNMLLLKA